MRPFAFFNPHQIAHSHLHPASEQGCVTVHLRRESLQAYVYGGVEHRALLGHIERQTVERRQHGYLERGRVGVSSAPLLLLPQTFRFLVRLSAAHEQHHEHHSYS